MSLRSIITALFERVPAKRALAPLTDDQVLIECEWFMKYPVTFGDFVRRHESPESATS